MYTKKPTTFQEYVSQTIALTPVKLLVEVTAHKNDAELSGFAEHYSNIFMVAFRNSMHQMMKEASMSKQLLTVLPTTVTVAQEIGPISDGLKYFHVKAIGDSDDARDYALYFGVLEGIVHEIQQLIVTATKIAAASLTKETLPTTPISPPKETPPTPPTKETPAPAAPLNSSGKPIKIETAHYAHTMCE